MQIHIISESQKTALPRTRPSSTRAPGKPGTGRNLPFQLILVLLAVIIPAAVTTPAFCGESRTVGAETTRSTPGPDQLISEIIISGNQRIDSGAIRKKISSRAGDRFDQERLRNDLKKVFAMGYFNDIRLLSETADNGRKITFEIKEKEIIGKINITGNDKVNEDDIRPIIKVKPNAIINELDLNESIANIRYLYHDKGYRNCEITVETTHVKGNRLDITFNIVEGEKVYLKTIIINGNSAFSDAELKDQLTIKEKGFFSFITDSGLLKEEALKHDSVRMMAFYHNNGYVEAKVSQPEIINKGEWFEVIFNVHEGERFSCGTIDFAGDLIAGKEALLKQVRVGREKYFSRKILREDILRLSDFYAEKGYAFADISPRTRKDPEENKINLFFSIAKNEQVSVNRIIIKGNTVTRDKVIRREMRMKEGGIFSASSIKKSNQALTRMDYFESVNITPEETGFPDKLDIVVEVTEKPTGKFSIGAGYSNVERFSVMGEISENNLFGRGQRLSAQANISSISTRFNIDFTEPRFMDSRLLTGFNVYNWEREYDEYTKDSRGGSFRLGYPIKWGWRFTGSYGYDDTSLTGVDQTNASQQVLDSMNFHITSSLKIGLSQDTRNRLYGASSGHRHSLTAEHAGGYFLGGDNSFTKLEASTSWYFPVTRHTNINLRISMGRVDGNADGHLPIYEKFYLGGLNSIRSFRSGEISPVDPASGDRIGGDKMWYANLEYQFPLVKGQGLMGVIFYDIGNVYAIEETWNFTRYKHSAGVGFRWMSPVGPLRLEWGYNLDPVGDERQSDWEFSIGAGF